MLIRRLDITGVRNISHASLTPLSRINIIFGCNGAGKTSVLEAVNLLSAAKSFRSHKLGPMIQRGLNQCVAFAEVKLAGQQGYQPVGVERSRSSTQSALIKIAGQRVTTAAALAHNLPLQVIHADTFKLLEGSPSVRRQYLDWGVFHVEHAYYPLWKSARRCLQQRNSLLRQGHGRIDRHQLGVWTRELCELAEQLDRLRQNYIRQLVPVFEGMLRQLMDIQGIGLSYNRGWDKHHDLSEVLARHIDKDLSQSFTGFGPHRADLRVRVDKTNAAETLSRGQQKIVICALRLAQGYLLREITKKDCVFLVDDLPAELDQQRRKAICSLLEQLECQVFITCVNPSELQACWSEAADLTMFHVEHGVVTQQKSHPLLNG